MFLVPYCLQFSIVSCLFWTLLQLDFKEPLKKCDSTRRSRESRRLAGGDPKQRLRTQDGFAWRGTWVSTGKYPFASWLLVWLIFQVEIDRRNAVQVDGMFMGVDSHQGMCQPKCFRSSDLRFIFFPECCHLFNE